MLKKLWLGIIYPLQAIMVVLVYLYKFCISPLLPKSCRFYPTCSTYMIISIREWGIFKGTWLGIKRILRCRPGGKVGEDFVPTNIKGELKWVF